MWFVQEQYPFKMEWRFLEILLVSKKVTWNPIQSIFNLYAWRCCLSLSLSLFFSFPSSFPPPLSLFHHFTANSSYTLFDKVYISYLKSSIKDPKKDQKPHSVRTSWFPRTPVDESCGSCLSCAQIMPAWWPLLLPGVLKKLVWGAVCSSSGGSSTF